MILIFTVAKCRKVDVDNASTFKFRFPFLSDFRPKARGNCFSTSARSYWTWRNRQLWRNRYCFYEYIRDFKIDDVARSTTLPSKTEAFFIKNLKCWHYGFLKTSSRSRDIHVFEICKWEAYDIIYSQRLNKIHKMRNISENNQ